MKGMVIGQKITAWIFAKFYFRFRGGLRGVDTHYVPQTGAVIVAPTHLSVVDPPALAYTSKRFMLYMAKEELINTPIIGWFCRSIGAYPVKRGEGDTESIRRSIAYLEAGEALCVFPEGTRGDGVTMLPINRGVAMLAKKTGVPVVPAAIVGSHIVRPRRGLKAGRAEVVVVFGPPFTYADCAGANERETREKFMQELQSRLLALSASQGLPLNPAPKDAAKN
ncbi:MAG: lysophospholipid acyltransferase family protein [Fimbriimonas sp.]